MGMIVTGLVMSAVAALLSAVARGWEQSGETQSNSTYRVQSHARIARILKGAKQLGAVRGGSIDGTFGAAAIMLWKGDANADGKVQFSEVGLLMHEGAVGTPAGYLAFYEVVYPSNWTVMEKAVADSNWADDDIYDDDNIDSFRTRSLVRATVVASNVIGVVFTRTDGVNITRPSLDYVLKFKKDNQVHVEYGTASVRPAAALPPSQR
ncbi:MAG: hypothetical protein QOE14_175 [Humisphaera sp.]|nr:hypothetical protein [Humisphaera sp.]